MQEARTLFFNWGWLVPVIFGIIFIISWRIDKRRLINGIWFNIAFFSFLTVLASWILVTNNTALIMTFGIPFVLIVLFLTLLFFMQSVLLIWNAVIVWRRESHSLGNMLTLVLGIVLLLVPFINSLAGDVLPQAWYTFFVMTSDFVVGYLLFWLYNYLTVLVLYQFNRPKLNQQYVVVLGSGLINGGQVPPLLAQRVDRGIAFYHKQLQKKGIAPKLILSGGQGGNETRPEGVAMREYAIEQDVPAEDTIAEDQSINTLQNMLFSKRLMTTDDGADPRAIFVTSNYHTLRAGLIARRAGLKADGIGSRTAKFFLPNAVIREYIAVFVRNKWTHAVVLGVGVIGIGALVLISTLFVK